VSGDEDYCGRQFNVCHSCARLSCRCAKAMHRQLSVACIAMIVLTRMKLASLAWSRVRQGRRRRVLLWRRRMLESRTPLLFVLRYQRSIFLGERPFVSVLWMQAQGETERRTFGVDMRCCRQEDTHEFSLPVTESAFFLLGRWKYRRDVSVVCVNTSVSHGTKLGRCDTAICYAGPLLRWTEVVSCTSLLCAVSVSTVNATLDTSQCRGAERECKVMGRAR
jgi:hypothetical protein